MFPYQLNQSIKVELTSQRLADGVNRGQLGGAAELRFYVENGAGIAGNFVEESIRSIREAVGDGQVICALSGGVDSAVVALLQTVGGMYDDNLYMSTLFELLDTPTPAPSGMATAGALPGEGVPHFQPPMASPSSALRRPFLSK